MADDESKNHNFFIVFKTCLKGDNRETSAGNNQLHNYEGRTCLFREMADSKYTSVMKPTSNYMLVK